MKRLYIRFLPPIILVVIISFFFLPQLLIGKMPIPADSLIGLYHPWRDDQFQGYNPGKYPVKNPLITDPILQTFPWRKTAIDNLKNLEIPLWNPYSFSGQPLLANIQSAALQPLNIIFLIFPFKYAWILQIIMGNILASLFTYIFLRSLNLQIISSLFGATVLPFTGFFVVWLTWGTISITASFLPLVLFCVNKITKKLTSSNFLILTIALALVFLAGHYQTAMYVLIAGIFYATFITITEKKWSILIIFFSSVVLSLLIASPQLLPAYEFLKASNRVADQSFFPQREDWFLPIQHLIQIIAPDYFGNPTKGNYWGVWNYGEFVSFIGILPLFFALLAILKTNIQTIFFVLLVFISLLFALNNPISQIPFILHFPIISSMQPSRIIYLLNFSLVVLAAYGLENELFHNNKKFLFLSLLIIFIPLSTLILITNISKDWFPNLINIVPQHVAMRNLIIPLVTTIVLSMLIILSFQKDKKGLLIFAIFAVTLTELFYFAYKFTPFSSSEIIYPKTKITDYLIQKDKPFRVMSTDRRIANPNSLTPYKIEAVSGYDPLYLKKYGQFANAWQSNQVKNEEVSLNRFITPENIRSNITDLMNVKFILTFDDINDPQFEKVLQEGETKIYKNNNALARVFFVTDIVRTQSKEETLNNLLKSTEIDKVAYANNFEFKNGDPNAQAEIIGYSDQSVLVRTRSRSDTPLVISNIYYPGWKAYIDGKEKNISEVDYLLQSVVIPQGEHILLLKYRPSIFFKALLISAVGLMILLASSAVIWKKSQ